MPTQTAVSPFSFPDNTETHLSADDKHLVPSVCQAKSYGQETKRYGCLLVNIGSPAQPEPREIREFLKLFLSDKRVVDLPGYFWKPILHSFVLPLRPLKIAKTYRSIWTEQGSPLMAHSWAQEKMLQEILGTDVTVRIAMTYSSPSVEEKLVEMEQLGITDLTIISLFPQYAASTVGAIFDQVFKFYKNRNYTPNLRFYHSWHKHPGYIDYYAGEVLKHLKKNKQTDALVFSYHSVPNRAVHTPSIYRQHCNDTTQLIMQRVHELNADPKVKIPKFFQTFQSKFGPGQWLKPATIETLPKLASAGYKHLLVATPGFFSDCIETVDEISVLNKEAFLNAGGLSFEVISPLNDDKQAGEILADLYRSLE